MQKVIFFSLGMLLLYSCTKEPESIKPAIVTMTESVYASVTVQPDEFYQVYSSTSGTLEKIMVKAGDRVKAGQTIAQISTTNPEINIESAQLNVNLSRENYQGQADILSGIEKEIKAVKKQLTLDSLNFFRQQNLWEQNIGSKFDLENKKLKYELTSNNLDILKKKYLQTKSELATNYKQSQNALKKAKSGLSDYFIKSNIDGTVYAINKNEGETISQQEPFAQVGKSKSFIIEMLIDEVDIAKIDTGQLALITLDAYEDQVFESIITKIYPLKNNRTQTFKIEGKFKTDPPKLYPGLSGEANIVLSVKKNTLTIPLEYLVENNKVNTPNGPVEVEVGMKNIEFAEIISGIDTTTIILKP